MNASRRGFLGARSYGVLLSVIALVATLMPMPMQRSIAVAAEPAASSYLLRHVRSDQYVAPDGWGPGVLASQHDGAMAEWDLVHQADGSVALRNSVTGWYLDSGRHKHGDDVGTSPEQSSTTSWRLVKTAKGLEIVGGGGHYLVADGFKVRTSTRPGAQGYWELIEVDRSTPRYVTLTNEESQQLLSVTGPSEDGLVVTADFDGRSPAAARWQLVEQVTTSRTCERQPAWNVHSGERSSYGQTSRVATCHVLLSRATGRALEADSAKYGFAVSTSASVSHDAYWNLSDDAGGSTITLSNASVGHQGSGHEHHDSHHDSHQGHHEHRRRYLADVDGVAVTINFVSPRSRWLLADVDGDCEYVPGVRIDSHQSGETVDTTSTGTTTGSFVLYGVAPADVTSIMIEAGGEVGVVEIDRNECENGWSIEVGAIATTTETYTVTAAGFFGTTVATISLDVIAPSETDVLLQPAFVETAQFHDLLISYDNLTGQLVFAGDVSDELEPGDGLGGDASAIAPDGYLRIVLGVEFDGVNTIVATRQAGLTEFIRQIEIDIDRANPAPIAPLDAAAVNREAEPAMELPVFDSGLLGTTAMLDEPMIANSAARALAASPIGDGADLTLDFGLDPDASFTLDIDWERPCRFCPIWLPVVDTFAFEVGLGISAEAEFVFSGAELFHKRDNFGPAFDDVQFARITVPTPSPIPLVVIFEADSQPFYDISVDAAARLQIDLTVNLVAGFEHESDGSGRGAYNDASVEGGAPQLDLDAGILMTAAVGLEVDIEAQLYGQAGIELEATPQLELEAIADVLTQEIPWTLKLVVPFSAGVDVEIELGPVEWSKEFGEIDFLELSLLLFEGVVFGDDGDTELSATFSGPPGVFPGQEFAYTSVITNEGSSSADDVSLTVILPDTGSFISSTPAGAPSSPQPSGTYTIAVGDVPAGGSETVTIRWRAPDQEGATLTATATVGADNRPDVGPLSSTVVVGVEGRCNPCGAATGGVGLRNRSQGTIAIAGLPAGAVVTRAVLTWGVLYSGTAPRDTITFGGVQVSADVAANVSGTLCWGDSNTIGYAADVTGLVTGNGSYVVSDPPRGVTRVDSDPAGVLPYTDGASLVVFYVGGGSNNQVISDFTYSTNTGGGIVRELTGVNSLGLGGMLTLAGPDGQNNADETFDIVGDGTITLSNTWEGSAPQDGPSFAIGNLWDNDTYDVSSILPAGQSTLQVSHRGGSDCVGVSATVLEIPQG